jgi:hypothetical protein
MKRILPPVACAAAILLSSVAIEAIASPAFAQMDDQVGFQTFHDVLAQSGDWVYSDRWGEVWIPTDVADDFQPYGSNGYWADSEYGWTWVSGYDWGDIPFHYGRWVNDPDDGWLWIPGYVWSPAWVVWRSNGRYVGWMAMPPDQAFLEGGPSIGISVGGGLNFSINFGNTQGYYGYSQWYGPGYDESRFASNWVFVDEGHIADRDFHRYQAPQSNYTVLIRGGTNITHYTVTNNFVVNLSVDPRAVQRASGHAVPVVHLAQIIKRPQFVTTANQGQQIQSRMRTQSPRGTGIANSAPRPSATVVQSLSTNITPRNGRPATHLFTRDTVTSAPLPIKRGGAVVPGATTSPGELTRHRDNVVSPTTTGPTTPTTTQPLQKRNVTAAPGEQPPATSTGSRPSGIWRRHDDQTVTPATGAPGTPTTGQQRVIGTSPNSAGQGNGAPLSGGANGQGNPPTQTLERKRHEQSTTPSSGPTQSGGAGDQPTQTLERKHHEQPSTPSGGPTQNGGTGDQPPPGAHSDFAHVRPMVTPPAAPTTTAPVKVTPPPPQGQSNPTEKPDKKKHDDDQPPH